MSPRQGGDSYPSGTPPYGVPGDHAFSRAGQPQSGQPGQPGRPGGQPGQGEPGDEPRTETTLTTRIKINIPGSRPIPPVVVRSPLTGEETGEQPAPRRHRAESAGSPVLGVMDSGQGSPATPDLPAEWRTPEPGAPAAPADGSSATPPSEWFAPRKKGAAPAAAAPAPAPAPAPAQPAPSQPAAPAREQRVQEPQARPQFQERTPGFDTQNSPWAPPQPQQPQQPQPQAGPPVARTAAGAPTLPPRPVPGGVRPGQGNPGGLPGAPQGGPLGARQTPEPGAETTMQFRAVPDGQAAGPARPKRGPQTAKAPKPKASAAPTAAERTAAMPVVPQPQSVNDGFAGGTGGAGAPPRPEPAEGGQGSGAAKPAAGRPAGGGRSRKLATYGVAALVLVGGVAYGAGLMLNQADVPKGTTVLGYSIGGDTHDEAVTALDTTLGAIAKHPLTVSIGGRTTTLNPSVAGLTIDTGATVDKVAQHSYNPVTVIGSLFGGAKAVAPVVVIDEDKLRSALQQLSAAGGAQEGSIHFTSTGKVVVTPAKAGSGLDVNAAVPLVEQAFQARAQGRPDAVVPLTVTTVQPKGSSAALTQAANTLGAWAVKQKFKVVVGGIAVPFGKTTFSESLTLQADASGKFAPTFDLAKLAAAYGTAFDGKHTKNGKAITAQDVAAALTTLLSQPDGPTSITI